MRYMLVVVSIAASIALSACGGGGGTTPSANLPSGGVSGSSGGSTTTSPSTTAGRATATFHVTIPPPPAATQSLKRHPEYIAAATNELYLSVGDTSFPPITTAAFAVDATHCTTNSDGSKSCTFTAQEPIAEDEYIFLGVNISNGVSLPLEVGETAFTATAGGPNTVSVTLDPIFAAVSLDALGGNYNPPPFALTLSLYDAVSEFIPVPSAPDCCLSSSVTITDTDTSGQSSLSIPGYYSGTSSVEPVSLSQTRLVQLNYTPSSLTAPADSFNLVINTIGFSINNGLTRGGFFPQAIPAPSDIPPMTTTYPVLCTPRVPVPNDPTYGSSPQPPVCVLTAPTSFTVN
jgi:hypothetical protein